MKTIRHFLILSLAGVLPAMPGPLRAAAFKQAEITQIFREVKTLEQSGARLSRLNETIGGEQSVKTGTQSRAELMFSDKSLTRLGADTIFSFQQGTRELELKQGTMLFQVPKGAGGAKIRTAAITAAITGTTGFYEYSPKAGRDGIIKFGILEGKATLFIKGRLGHFITVGPGEMVICTAKPRDFNTTEVVHFDIQKFTATCALIARMGGLAPAGERLVKQEIAQQEKEFVRTKELFATNLVIPGSGTEVFVLSQLDQRFTADPVAQQAVAQNSSQTAGTPAGSGGALPSGGGLPTITSPNPYVVNGGTVINTDPTITTNGVTDIGATYRSAALDGRLSRYLFGSTSAFDNEVISSDSTISFFPLGLAAFKFSNLTITGPPTYLTAGGAVDVALVSEGTITSGAPGGVFNLDPLDNLFLGTVNGSITFGPELSFTSARTYVPAPTGNGLGLILYARGAASDVVFGSNVNFADRSVQLTAERNVEISSQITALSSTDPLTRLDSDVNITAGNNFILDPTGLITASRVSIKANDVAGSGGALVDAVDLEIRLGNVANLTQAGPLLFVNTLPISQTTLQNFDLEGNAGVNLPGDVTINTAPPGTGTGRNIGLFLGSNAGDVVINGHLTTNYHLRIEAFGKIIFGPSGQITATKVNFNGTAGVTVLGDVTIATGVNPGDSGLSIRSEAGNVTINGHLTTDHELSIEAATNFVLGPAGRITAPNFHINSQDVAGSGSAVIDGASAQIRIKIQNVATLTQAGNLVKVNSLPIDQTNPLQNLQISADAGVNVPFDVNINTLAPGPGPGVHFDLNSNGALTINGRLTTTEFMNIEVKSLVVGPLASLQAPNVYVSLTDTVNPATVTVSGSNILFNSLPIDLSFPSPHASLSAPTIQVAPNLVLPVSANPFLSVSVELGRTHPNFVLNTNTLLGWTADTVQVPGNITGENLMLGGNTTVSGNVNATGLGVATLNAGGTVSTNGIYWDGAATFNGDVPDSTPAPTGPPPASPSTLTAPVVGAPFGISFDGPNEGSNTGGNTNFPNNGHDLTLNTSAVVFDTANASPFIGPSSFNGGDALPGGSKAGGNGGTLNVNTTGDLTVNTTISASSGVNATGVLTGGKGGNVNLASTGGTVTVTSSIDVSHNDVANRRVSSAGGNIKLQSGKTAGVAVNVTNSANLRALLNAAAPGPGGKVEIVSAGGDINVAGSIQADRGLVDIRNNGALGIINLQNGHNISADVVKVGALGNNGVLNIGSGTINATSLLKLYAGGSNGTINFVNNVNLSGGTKIIAAKTVNVNSGVNVGISGSAATFHTDNANYNGAGSVRAGFGTVTGPGATQSHASRPAFDP